MEGMVYGKAVPFLDIEGRKGRGKMAGWFL